MTIQEQVEKIVYPVYQVGGSVRDILMGIAPKDYDFATPLTPEEIEIHIKNAGKRCYNLGKKFGTLGMKIDGEIIEVTTFRQEKYTTGNRKPEVSFVKDITADLSRRDFRMNAIALKDGRYIDPFGGRLDIIEKKIRCVGEPKDRFKEDPLRLLRVARFAAQLGFEIDPFLESIAKKMAYKILEISKERWVMEMDKLLMTDTPSIGLDFMARTNLLNYMIPELSLQVEYDQNSPYHTFTLWEHTKKVVDCITKDIDLRWAALLHDIAKPFVRHDRPDRSNYINHEILGADMVDGIALKLKWSNDRRKVVKELVLDHLKDSSPLKEADSKSK